MGLSIKQEVKVLSVPKFTANQYCISLNIYYTLADAVQICGNFWDTQYCVTWVPRNLYQQLPRLKIKMFIDFRES